MSDKPGEESTSDGQRERDKCDWSRVSVSERVSGPHRQRVEEYQPRDSYGDYFITYRVAAHECDGSERHYSHTHWNHALGFRPPKECRTTIKIKQDVDRICGPRFNGLDITINGNADGGEQAELKDLLDILADAKGIIESRLRHIRTTKGSADPEQPLPAVRATQKKKPKRKSRKK